MSTKNELILKELLRDIERRKHVDMTSERYGF